MPHLPKTFGVSSRLSYSSGFGRLAQKRPAHKMLQA